MSKFMTKMYTDVQNGGEQAVKWANLTGMSVEELAHLTENDMAGALQVAIKGMGEFADEGGNLDQMLRDLGISEARQLDVLKRMAGGYDVLEDAISMASKEWETNTALVDEANIRYGTFLAQMKIFYNRLRIIFKNIGNVFMEVLIDLANAITPLIDKIEQWTQSLIDADTGAVTPLGKALGVLAIALTAVFAALIPLGIITSIVGMFFSMIRAIGIAEIAFARIFGVILGGIGVVVTATLMFITFREEINAFVSSVVDKFPWVETAFNAVKDAINAVWEAIQPYVKAIGTAIAVTLSIIATVMSFQQVWLALVAVMKLVGAAIGFVFALLLLCTFGKLTKDLENQSLKYGTPSRKQ